MNKNPKESALYRYIIDFLEYCEIEKNKSKLTVRNYHHYLNRFAEFADSKGISDPKQIDLDVVRTYRLYLNRYTDDNGRGLKLITQNYHVIALRAFLKYLIKRDVKTLAPEKIELAKNPSREVSVLTNDEIERLLKTLEQEPKEILRLRDLSILLTLFSSGIRISELVQLKITQVNLERGEFTVRGKGDKLRLVFLSPAAVTALANYLKSRRDNHPALFINHSKVGQSVTKQMDSMATRNDKDHHKAAGLTARTVQRIVHKYAMLAGITHKVSPHTFRHSFATDLLQNGADIRSVQSLLGHASITTTQIYTHVTNQGLRDIHKKFHNKK
jgi:site-specific recombinase XerD